jgi:hypothetical protein
MKPFKFLRENKDLPYPESIKHSTWLMTVFRQGWNASIQGIYHAPTEYRVSHKTLSAWYQGYWAAQNGR